VAPQALDVHLTWPLCPGVVDLVDPIQAVLQWDVVVNGDLVLDMRLEPFEGVHLWQCLQTVSQFPLCVLELAAKLTQVHSLLLECMMCTLVLPDLSLECDILLEVEGFVNKHGEGLVLEEKVFFFCTKNTPWVWVLAGSEVAGLNGVTVTVRQEDLGKQGWEVILDKGDRDLGGAIECGDVVMVGVWDPTRVRVDTDEGSVVSGGATSLDKVTDKVVDGHDNGGVIDFDDWGCTMCQGLTGPWARREQVWFSKALAKQDPIRIEIKPRQIVFNKSSLETTALR
jgi:hypothetical protein